MQVPFPPIKPNYNAHSVAYILLSNANGAMVGDHLQKKALSSVAYVS